MGGCVGLSHNVCVDAGPAYPRAGWLPGQAARRTKCEHVYERPIAIADHRAAQHFTDPCPLTAETWHQPSIQLLTAGRLRRHDQARRPAQCSASC